MKLISIKYRNFKKLREFTLEPNGEDISIFGDNAVGKTTLKDGFLWGLFDKNSKNQKAFEIKTIGPDKQPLHYLDHEIEMVLDLGDRVVTLRKVYAEKYTKKRGSAKEEFSGHTTSYYIDGVPVQLNQYKDAIDQIAGREETFRLLTDPGYFVGATKWQDRRKILLEACGNVSDADVIASDIKLAGLPAILGKRSLDNQKKIIAAQRTKINDELKLIPARIDEATRALPETTGDKEAIETELNTLRARRDRLQGDLTNVQTGGGIAQRNRELAEIETQIIGLENEQRRLANAGRDELEAHKRALQNQLNSLTDEVAQKQRAIAGLQRNIAQDQVKVDLYRAEWKDVNAVSLGEDATLCPSCKQTLPEDRQAKVRADFNVSKANRLEKLVSLASSVKRSIEDDSAAIDRLTTDIKQAEIIRDQVVQQIAGVDKELVSLNQAPCRIVTDQSALQELLQKKDKIQADIESLKADKSSAITDLNKQIADITAQISEKERALAQFGNRKNGLKRIEDLKAQEKKLAAEYEELERQLNLCESFIRAKVGLLTDRINSRFACTQWKLFEEQINGGLTECCVALGQDKDTGAWVPYDTDLNGGGRMNVGLDCINTLSEFYGIECPIWIDEAGEVTHILPTRGQQIRLYVSESDKTLRVETVKEAAGVA